MPKVLLDENLPRPLRNLFSEELVVTTVADMGWPSTKNGALMRLMAEAGFTHLVTADRNLEFQQNLDSFSIQLVVLITFDIRLHYFRPYVPMLETAICAMNASDKIIHVDLTDQTP